jgi:hypothetical protein
MRFGPSRTLRSSPLDERRTTRAKEMADLFGTPADNEVPLWVGQISGWFDGQADSCYLGSASLCSKAWNRGLGRKLSNCGSTLRKTTLFDLSR